MANLRNIKKRINNIGVIEKITQSMKVISTTRLSVAKSMRYNNKQYFEIPLLVANQILKIYKNSKNLSTFSSDLFVKKATYTNTLIIFITSNTGLCGAYNSNVFRLVSSKILELDNEHILLAPIGDKAISFSNMVSKNSQIKGISSTFKTLQPYEIPLLAYKITQLVKDKTIDSIQIIYTESISMLEQKLHSEVLLPILSDKDTDCSQPDDSKAEVVVENAQLSTDIETTGYDVEELFYRYISAHLYDKIAYAQIAEYSSRLNAMDTANTNSKDLKDSLNLEYNKTRQSVITRELIEIISGAESI